MLVYVSVYEWEVSVIVIGGDYMVCVWGFYVKVLLIVFGLLVFIFRVLYSIDMFIDCENVAGLYCLENLGRVKESIYYFCRFK